MLENLPPPKVRRPSFMYDFVSKQPELSQHEQESSVARFEELVDDIILSRLQEVESSSTNKLVGGHDRAHFSVPDTDG